MRVVTLGPQFDTDSVLRVRADEETTGLTIFNLQAVTRVHWMALALMIDCRERLQNRGCDLALVGAGAKLRQALESLGLQGRLPVYDSVEAAQNALQAGITR